MADDPDFSVRWREDGAIFTIERPAKMNALTKPVLEGLSACLDRLEARGDRLLVIEGRGAKAFCAGTDLAEMQGMAIEARLDKSAMARDLLVRLSRMPLLSIAAIEGAALGGGLELAMACTLRIATETSLFGLPEIKLNLLPAYAGTQFLPAIVGPARALELMLTGRSIDAREALAIGLVHRIAADGVAIEDAALSLAQEVLRNSWSAVAAIRACIDAAGAVVAEPGLAVEDRWVREIFSGADAERGVARFLERRSR